jgi:hypothetical protein
VAGSLVFGFTSYLGANNAEYYFITAFGATLFTYNLHRILRRKEIHLQHSIRHVWIVKHPIILYALAIIGLGLSSVFYLLYFINLTSLILLGTIGVISVFYAWRVKSSGKTLREIPYLKIYLIAVSWVVVCFVWPILQEQHHVSDYWHILLSSLLFIFSATIPFDIRDLPFDAAHQKTIPHIFGVKKAKIIALAALIISFLLLNGYTTDILSNPYFIIGYVGMFVWILFTQQKNNELYFSLLIDGWIIFYGLGMFTF